MNKQSFTAKPEVDPIRRASRQIVRELHLLDGKLCIEGFTFSECHLLTELESLGQASATELGERLVLEKSTMSRLVNGMLGQGYIAASADPADARRRLLCLTDKGRQGLENINHYSNRQVDQALDFVTPKERKSVVKGLDRYAKSLRYARTSRPFRIRPMRQEDNPAVARIIRRVMTEFGATGCGYSINDAEVDAMYEAYPAPRSAFFVIERNRKVLGCGGMGPLNGAAEDVCELRKMYFQPELRGSGLGTRLLGKILESAREAGYSQVYLETLDSMSQARSLYKKHGFKSISHAMGNTGHSSCNRFMVLPLKSKP
jgi:putative acetyltransferase